MLACRRHWYDLPGQLRVAILTSYRGGDRKGYVANVRAAELVWRRGFWRLAAEKALRRIGSPRPGGQTGLRSR